MRLFCDGRHIAGASLGIFDSIGGHADRPHQGEMAMLTSLKMAVVAVLLVVSGSTALAQRMPIDSQSPTLPLDYGPYENMSRAQ
jgi:hypothetical protein